jgi:hypothetical protein
VFFNVGAEFDDFRRQCIGSACQLFDFSFDGFNDCHVFLLKKLVEIIYVLSVGRFNLRRSVGEKPILFNSPINIEISADLNSSTQYRAIRTAAISKRNLSALVSQKALERISSHIDLTGFGNSCGGSGKPVKMIGSFFRSLRRPGWFLNAPRHSGTAVGVLGLANRFSILAAARFSHMPVVRT